MSEKLFYLQVRKPCGNSVSWWAINDRGYTLDIRCAKVWSEKEATEKELRSFEKFWPKESVDRLIQYHIDHQDLERKKDGSVFDNNPHTLVQWRPDLVSL